MELKHIKIDTDIRMKVETEIKERKIESTKETSVNKDAKDHKNPYYEKLEQDNSKEKKYLVVDGIKDTGMNVSVEVEKIESMNQENSRGRVLDTKK